MIKPISVLLVSTLALTACGQSRLNPFNWFGRSERVVVAEGEVNPLIPERSALRIAAQEPYRGVRIAEIRELKIDALPGGAVLRITALSDTLGTWGVKIEPLNDGLAVDKKLSFEMLAVPKRDAKTGPERSRLITAAHYLTDQDLVGVRSIEVLGARNGLVSRR